MLNKMAYIYESVTPHNLALLYVHWCFYMFVTSNFATIPTRDPCMVRLGDSLHKYNDREARQVLETLSEYFADFHKWAK